MEGVTGVAGTSHCHQGGWVGKLRKQILQNGRDGLSAGYGGVVELEAVGAYGWGNLAGQRSQRRYERARGANV